MRAKRAKNRNYAGVTLIESMVAAVAIAVAALGGLSYEYHSAKHTKIASAQMAATRTAQLLLEDWKSTGGSAEYDPERLGLGFSPAPAAAVSIPASLSQTSTHTTCASEMDGLPMLFALRCADVAHDEEAQVTLRMLAVIAECGEVDAEASAPWLKSIPTVTLTTYARTDASGG